MDAFKALLQRMKWKRLPFIHKILLFYMPLIVLPIIAGMYYVTSNFYETSRGVMTENTEDLLDLVVEKLEQEFQGFESLSLQFFVDTELRQSLQTEAETYLELAQNKNDLEKRVHILLGSYRPYISSVILTSGSLSYHIGGQETILKDKEYEVFLERMNKGEGSVAWGFNTRNINGEQVFLLGRHINELDRFKHIGELIFVIDPRFFKYVLEETKISQTAKFDLYADEEALNKPSILTAGNENLAGEDQNLMTTVKSGTYDWALTTLIPLDQLNHRTKQSVAVALIVTLLCVLLGLGATQLIVMDLVIPIRKLMNNMRRGIRGIQPSELERFKGAREVTELNDTFISVLYEIYNLNHEVMKTQQKRQQMEMKVLQNQISPHFLYNTLNSIRWMAMIQKQDNIKEMVDSLTSLLSYSIRDTNQPILLADEIEILKDYVKIQKVRYFDFTMQIDIPDHLMNAQMLRFLLQPIIENAVIHGIADSNRSGEITIKAVEESDSQLHIVISDNGVGMDEARLQKVRDVLQGKSEEYEGRHLGIRNIQERIQLHYGSDYGIRIESVKDVGTSVHLILPIRYPKKRIKLYQIRRGDNCMNVEAYLNRIGYTGELDGSAKTLAAIQSCHLHHIPYENLDILEGIPLSLHIEDLYEKIVVRRRGGYCFELNALFGWLLRELGYPVVDYFARFWRDEPDPPPKRRHQVLRVTAEGKDYLCDVGVGGIVPREPILMEEGLEQQQGEEAYKLDRDPEFGWMLKEYKHGQWKSIYSFTEEPQLAKDFIMATYWCEHSPDSMFKKLPILSIRTPDGRHTVRGKEFKKFTPEGVDIYVPQTDAEFKEALTNYFGIKL